MSRRAERLAQLREPLLVRRAAPRRPRAGRAARAAPRPSRLGHRQSQPADVGERPLPARVLDDHRHDVPAAGEAARQADSRRRDEEVGQDEDEGAGRELACAGARAGGGRGGGRPPARVKRWRASSCSRMRDASSRRRGGSQRGVAAAEVEVAGERRAPRARSPRSCRPATATARRLVQPRELRRVQRHRRPAVDEHDDARPLLGEVRRGRRTRPLPRAGHARGGRPVDRAHAVAALVQARARDLVAAAPVRAPPRAARDPGAAPAARRAGSVGSPVLTSSASVRVPGRGARSRQRAQQVERRRAPSPSCLEPVRVHERCGGRGRGRRAPRRPPARRTAGPAMSAHARAARSSASEPRTEAPTLTDSSSRVARTSRSASAGGSGRCRRPRPRPGSRAARESIAGPELVERVARGAAPGRSAPPRPGPGSRASP